MAARRRRRAAPARTATVSSVGSCSMGKSWCVVCGLVCLVLGVMLWKGMWALEAVVALLLVLGGLKHLFFGLKG